MSDMQGQLELRTVVMSWSLFTTAITAGETQVPLGSDNGLH